MTIHQFNHWSEVPPGLWRWKNFSPAEIACRGTGKIVIDEEALDALQRLRDMMDAPMIVRSAYRSPEHNARVGGATRSKHMEGIAFDIAMAGHVPHDFEQAARECGFEGFGFYPEARNDFMHIDLGPRREWGTRWPRQTPEFRPEPPIAKPPKPLSQSRTIKGAGAAGSGSLGAATVEVVQEQIAAPAAAGDPSAAEQLGQVLTDLSVQVEPLAVSSGLGWLKLAFLGLAFTGACVAAYARWDDARKAVK